MLKGSLWAAFFWLRTQHLGQKNQTSWGEGIAQCLHAQMSRYIKGLGKPRGLGGLSMRRWNKVVACFFLMVSAHVVANAQERIYRCGNAYTNHLQQARQNNCQVVEGANITFIQGSSNAASNRPTGAAKQVAAPLKSRENDARVILEAELAKARLQLQTLYAELQDGPAPKTALELRNPQLYQERIDTLKSRISRQEADIAGIERELERHTHN